MRQVLFICLLVVAALPRVGQAASTDLFGGSLGNWLQAEAIPELTTLLAMHPRFVGERIKVVAMTDGQPTTASDRLTQAIREQLTHKLTRVKGVQIAWRETSARCGIPRKTPYLLGIEVIRQSASKYLVRIAMVDVVEGVWVSGAHLQWRGRFTTEERRALARPVVDAPVGTIDQPLPATQRSAVVKHLLRNVECTLRGGLEGSVFVVAADERDPLLVGLVAELRQKLTQSALLDLADNKRGADWWLMLDTTTDVGEAVVATLVTPEINKAAEPVVAQRLASVYVQRATGRVARRVQPSNNVVGVAPTPKRVTPANLIEGLHRVNLSAGDQCFARSADCVEVGFELAAPGYLLVLRTRPDGGMSLGSCSSPKRTAGAKRFRLPMRAGGAGFYAIATEDQNLANRLQKILHSGASNCGASVADGWLDRLEDLLASQPAHIDWRPFYASPEQGSDGTALAENRSRNRRQER